MTRAAGASFRPPLVNKALLPPSLPYSGLHMSGYGGVFISHRGSHLIPVRVDCKNRLITHISFFKKVFSKRDILEKKEKKCLRAL